MFVSLNELEYSDGMAEASLESSCWRKFRISQAWWAAGTSGSTWCPIRCCGALLFAGTMSITKFSNFSFTPCVMSFTSAFVVIASLLFNCFSKSFFTAKSDPGESTLVKKSIQSKSEKRISVPLPTLPLSTHLSIPILAPQNSFFNDRCICKYLILCCINGNE